MGVKFFNLSLLVLLVGMSFLPPHQGLLRDKEPFYLQYLQPEKMGCHCDTHKELAQAFQQQYREFNGKIAYMVDCSTPAFDQAFSSLKLMLLAPHKATALAFSEISSQTLPSSFSQPSRQLSPPEPPPRLS